MGYRYPCGTWFYLVGMVVVGAARSIVVKLAYQSGFRAPLTVTLLSLAGKALALPARWLRQRVVAVAYGEYDAVAITEEGGGPPRDDGDEGSGGGSDVEGGTEAGAQDERAQNGDLSSGGAASVELTARRADGDDDGDADADARPSPSGTSPPARPPQDAPPAPARDGEGREEGPFAPEEEAAGAARRPAAIAAAARDCCAAALSALAPPADGLRGSRHGLTAESEAQVSWVHRVPFYARPALPALFSLLASALRWTSVAHIDASVAEMLISGSELVLR